MAQANVDQALSLVAQHFAGMTDKDGEPYVMHCLRVMMGVEDPRAKLIGLMHDLVEDTPVTLNELRELGFSDEVVEGVRLVTHTSEDTYSEYVVRLKSNELARQVKLSDLRDNTALHRVLFRGEDEKKDSQRIQRYILTYQFLTDRIDEDTYRSRMQPVDSQPNPAE